MFDLETKKYEEETVVYTQEYDFDHVPVKVLFITPEQD